MPAYLSTLTRSSEQDTAPLQSNSPVRPQQGSHTDKQQEGEDSWLKEVRKGERGAEDREMKKKLKSERQDPGGEKLQIRKFSLTRQKKKMIGSKDKWDKKRLNHVC